MKRAVSKINGWKTDRADRQSTFVARCLCVSTNQLGRTGSFDACARALSSVKVVFLDFKSGKCVVPLKWGSRFGG